MPMRTDWRSKGFVKTIVEAIARHATTATLLAVVSGHRHPLRPLRAGAGIEALTDRWRSLAARMIERAAGRHVEITLDDRPMPVPVRAPPRCG
jgi:hypothetical protein